METKLFEIRDEGTFIQAIGVQISAADGYVARAAGYGYGRPLVFLSFINRTARGSYDPYEWPNRTMKHAHSYIQEKWDELKNGALIDVQFILHETTEPKISCEHEVLR